MSATLYQDERQYALTYYAWPAGRAAVQGAAANNVRRGHHDVDDGSMMMGLFDDEKPDNSTAVLMK